MARFGVFAALAAAIVGALVLQGAGARTALSECSFGYPPSVFAGMTGVAMSCTVPIAVISITRTHPITNLSKWAVLNGTSFSSGSCVGEHTKTVTCNLGSPGLVPGATFVEDLAPPMRVGERLKVVFKNVRRRLPIVLTPIVPAGPKLSVTSVVTPDPTTQAPPETAFDFKITINGGKFYRWDMVMPPGNTVVNSLSAPTNGLTCGQQGGGLFECFEQGVKPLPAGTFTFGIEVAQPIPAGTVSKCDVFGDGVQQGSCELHWYQGG